MIYKPSDRAETAEIQYATLYNSVSAYGDQPSAASFAETKNSAATASTIATELFTSLVPPTFAAAPVVREGGVEPPRPCGHWNLNPARLPFRHSRNVEDHSMLARDHPNLFPGEGSDVRLR